MEYYSAVKRVKRCHLQQHGWTWGLSFYMKSDREDKYHIISLMWNLKYDTKELIYKTETDSQTKQICLPKGKAGGGVIN